MGRGKRKDTGSSGRIPLGDASASSRPVQILPAGLIQSLRPVPPARERKPRADKAPPLVAIDGTLAPLALAVLQALAAQSDQQRANGEWNGSRVPNGMLALPEGVSESKYRKVLTELRRVGYVHTKNGMWWVLPAGRVQLGQDPSL